MIQEDELEEKIIQITKSSQDGISLKDLLKILDFDSTQI